MKRSYLIALIFTFLPALLLAADETKPSESEKAYQEYMGKMQAQMQLMQQQMQQLQSTTDSEERQKLLHEHWESMQQAMNMLDGTEAMPGCGTMMGMMYGGGGMYHMGGMHGMGMHGMGWWKPDDTSPQALTNRQQMMGACMGMQQQMMNQMMLHQHQMMWGR